ncbi:hypothetical protein IKF02_03445 [Candidatus Saccharibacteria bacterium]|nr:hypothetical protein [Candidatus Saccharibacteria bacterium]
MNNLKISISGPNIIVSGVDINKETTEKINEICIRKKKKYLSGYEHSRRTRVKLADVGVFFNKWESYPNVCITYLFKKEGDDLIINAIIPTQPQHATKTQQELEYWRAMWQQDVADELETLFTKNPR